MKIAVLGAPGAGKSEFARDLYRLLPGKNILVDGYVEDLRTVTGQEYGMLGDHIDDLQVAFKRIEIERSAVAFRYDHVITVGAILDTAAHNFARSEVTSDNRDQIALTQTKLQAVAATFGLLYTDTWDYDYAFLLTDRILDGYARLVQYTLETLVSTYRAPVLSFNPEVEDDQKAKLAAETIRALEETQPPEADDGGVRRSGEDREADGDSSEPVPDVPEQRGASDDA